MIEGYGDTLFENCYLRCVPGQFAGRDQQAIPKDTFVLWDSSRLIRLVFTIAAHDGSLVGAVASTAQARRRTRILPLVARNLRRGRERPSVDYELDGDDGVVATLREFDAHNEDCWPKAFHFVTDYLTQVRHGLYDARADHRKARANPGKSVDQRRHRPDGAATWLVVPFSFDGTLVSN